MDDLGYEFRKSIVRRSAELGLNPVAFSNVTLVPSSLATPGADLVHKKTISLMDALLGFERMLTLLDGTRVPIFHDQVTSTLP